MRRIPLATAAVLAAASPALAHVDPAAHGSLSAGLSHPVSGLDHVLAMVAVGLWAGMLGGRAAIAVPAAFVAVMAAGFAVASAGIALPLVEPAILASIVVLGLVVASAVRLPTLAGAALVGAFALFHGHAHGAELGAASALPYLLGFAAATALLHATGLGLGWAAGRWGEAAVRALGAATAAAGLGLSFGLI